MLGWSFASFRREIAEPANVDPKTTPWLHGTWKGVATIVRPVRKVTPPPMQELERIHDKYRKIDNDPPELSRTVSYVAGYVAAALWERGATAVIDARKPLTGPNLRDALETLHAVDIDGFATVSFSPTDHRPQSSAGIHELAPGGGLQPVGQPIAVPLQPEWIGY